MTTYSILGLCGSLRAKSFSLIALKTAGELMPAGMTLTIANYADVPIFNQDVQDQGWPAWGRFVFHVVSDDLDCSTGVGVAIGVA